MLEELNYQDVIEEKIKRQRSIPELEFHAAGHCVHIGKISPGCRGCFTNERGGGVQIGNLCMCNCPMCYYDRNRKEQDRNQTHNIIADHFYDSLQMGIKPIAYSYQSSGETLMYLDDIEKTALIHRQSDKSKGINIYHHVYTNGILADDETLERLKNMGAHELRYHVTASLYNKNGKDTTQDVIKSMYKAAKMGFSVTIEEPSYPLHRKELFGLLPILEDCGGKHLDIVEIQLTQHNFNDIQRHYPNGRYYKDYFYHLYDEGLVYDIMEEVISKKYNFSVIDCSSAVERCRQGKFQSVGFRMESIEGLCDDFPYFDPQDNPNWFYEKNINRLKSLDKMK